MTTDAKDSAAEIERLRAERDAAVAALKDKQARPRHGVVRRVVLGVIVVLFAVLVPVTATATWAHRTVLDTDTYVSTVAPIGADPAVTAAVSRQITDQLYASLDPQSVIADALPPKAAFLAGPIANGAKDAIRNAVNKVLNSDQFQRLWENANRFAHTQLVTVLRGDSTVLQTTKGQVVLNLVPLVSAAMSNAQTLISGVVGKQVKLPTITSNEIPSVACEKISAALDRPVPQTCGQIPLFPAEKLQNAQRAVRAFDRAVLALLIVTPLFAAAALAISRRRRRTLLQLSVGAALGLVIVRRAVMWEQNQLIDAGKPENREARSAIVHGLLNGFFDLTAWVLGGLALVVVVALVTGPYRWAVRMRGAVANAGRRTWYLAVAAVKGTSAGVSAGVAGATARAQSDTTLAWVRGHFDLLRVLGVVAAILLLLAVNVNFWSFLVIAALLALYEVWLYRLRPAETVVLPPSPADTPETSTRPR